MINSPQVDVDIKTSAVKGLPVKLTAKQHAQIQQIFTQIKTNSIDSKNLLIELFKKINVNKEFSYAEKIVSYLDDKDIEIKTQTQNTLDILIKNEKERLRNIRQEYEAKIKELK